METNEREERGEKGALCSKLFATVCYSLLLYATVAVERRRANEREGPCITLYATVCYSLLLCKLYSRLTVANLGNARVRRIRGRQQWRLGA